MLKTALRIMPRPAIHKPSPDFDFFMGIWSVRHRFLVKRLANCHDWIEFDGCCAVRKILNGWGNCDEGDIEMPGNRFRGMSLRTWDPAAGKWSIYWLDSRRPGHVTPPVVGGFQGTPGGPLGIFLGEDEHTDRAVRVRFVWSRVTETSARWEQAFSPDGGSTWETNWYMDFTRM